MNTTLKGKVWIFDNDIDTDQIIPSQYLLLPTIEDMKQYAFEPLDCNFSMNVKPGEILVAGKNFGCGSSREQAPRVLKALGVSAIIAQSFARIFFRNAINIGLPVLVCDDLYENIKVDDILEVDINNGVIKRDSNEFLCTNLPEHIMNILDAGGLIEFINTAM